MRDWLTEMVRNVVHGDVSEDLGQTRLAHINQHVCVAEALHGAGVGAETSIVVDFASKIVFVDFVIHGRGDSVVVELVPLAVWLGLEESKVMAAVEVSAMDQDTAELGWP